MWTEYIIAITHITSGDKHYTKCIMSLTAQLSCDTYYYHPPLQLRKQRFYEVRGGNSLVIQWLGVCTFTAEARVQFLVREIGSCKPWGMAKERKQLPLLVTLTAEKLRRQGMLLMDKSTSWGSWCNAMRRMYNSFLTISLNHRERSDKLKLVFYIVAALYFSKMPRSRKTRKDWRTASDQRKLRNTLI